MLIYSGLRRVGEVVKEKSENLLTCGCVRVYAYARDARCARVCALIGGGNGKGGRNEKKSGEEAKREGDEERKGSRSGDEGGAGREE